MIPYYVLDHRPFFFKQPVFKHVFIQRIFGSPAHLCNKYQSYNPNNLNNTNNFNNPRLVIATTTRTSLTKRMVTNWFLSRRLHLFHLRLYQDLLPLLHLLRTWPTRLLLLWNLLPHWTRLLLLRLLLLWNVLPRWKVGLLHWRTG